MFPNLPTRSPNSSLKSLLYKPSTPILWQYDLAPTQSYHILARTERKTSCSVFFKIISLWEQKLAWGNRNFWKRFMPRGIIRTFFFKGKSQKSGVLELQKNELNLMVKTLDFGQIGVNSVLSFTNLLPLNLSKPHLLYLKNGNNNMSFIGLVWRLNQVTHEKSLAPCLTQRKD